MTTCLAISFYALPKVASYEVGERKICTLFSRFSVPARRINLLLKLNILSQHQVIGGAAVDR